MIPNSRANFLALASELSDAIEVVITFDDSQTVSGSLSDFGAGAVDADREVVALFSDLAVPSLLQTGYAADFDHDGDVDGDDFLVWQSNLGSQQAAAFEGDADGDFDVDGNDFLVWQRQFGSTGGVGGTAIPEPGTWALRQSACPFSRA